MINMENREEIKQYSLEWYKEMRKLNKDTIISLVESNGKQRDALKEQNKALLDEIERLKSRIIYWNELHSEVIKDNSKLQFELKDADSVNEGLSNLIKDVYDKTDNVKIFLLIEERLESNDLMNIILPNQPK